MNVFQKTAILTLIILIIGISIGVWLDSQRVQEVKNALDETTINWNDISLQSMYFSTFNETDCNASFDANIAFADRIYAEGQKLDVYEEENKLSPSLISEKKKYALLKMQFWFNSMNIKKACNLNLSTIVYFYSHYDTSLQTTAAQKTQSNVLLDLKHKCGRKLMLIPVPYDLGLTSIDLVKQQYEITKAPTILIDEKIKLEGLQSINDLDKYIEC